MNTHDTFLMLINCPELNELAMQVTCYRDLCTLLEERGIDAINGVSIYSGDIDHTELDSRWAEWFGSRKPSRR